MALFYIFFNFIFYVQWPLRNQECTAEPTKLLNRPLKSMAIRTKGNILQINVGPKT